MSSAEDWVMSRAVHMDCLRVLNIERLRVLSMECLRIVNMDHLRVSIVERLRVLSMDCLRVLNIGRLRLLSMDRLRSMRLDAKTGQQGVVTCSTHQLRNAMPLLPRAFRTLVDWSLTKVRVVRTSAFKGNALSYTI